MASPSSTSGDRVVGQVAGFANLCLGWISGKLGIPGWGGDSAATAFSSNRYQSTVAPKAGDIVLFSGVFANNGQGHAGIYDGNGNVLSVLPAPGQGTGGLGWVHLTPLNDLVTNFEGGASHIFVSADQIGPGTRNKALSILQSYGALPLGVQQPANPVSQMPINVPTGINGAPAITGGGNENPGTAPAIGSMPGPGTALVPNSKNFADPLGVLTCPPKPPDNNDTPVWGGLINAANQIAYVTKYASCGVQATVKTLTEPAYWWRALFVIAGVAVILIGLLRLLKTEEASLVKHAVTG